MQSNKSIEKQGKKVILFPFFYIDLNRQLSNHIENRIYENVTAIQSHLTALKEEDLESCDVMSVL